jgi:hypothetical protein
MGSVECGGLAVVPEGMSGLQKFYGSCLTLLLQNVAAFKVGYFG